LIHIELERFGRQQLGDDGWARAEAAAKLAGKAYVPSEQYDDGEAVTLVVEAAKLAGVGPQALLESFGHFLAVPLIESYGYLIPPQWRTLDLVANTEELIHTALRASDPAAQPPLLRTTPRGKNALVVHYASARQMCGVAKGLIRGVAAHYGDEVEVTEESCMLAGAPTCAIVVRLIGPNI